MRALLDPRLRVNLAERYTSRCTIAQITFTTSASGQKVRSGNSPIAGLINIPCLLGPLVQERPTDTDMQNVEVVERRQSRQCKLSGSFPQLNSLDLVGGIEAVVDGDTYPVKGIDGDSAKYSNRLLLEVRKPYG
jgi:hypothetical protein